MKFDPRNHQRRSLRLKDYDYAQPGAYFVTLCTWQRQALFGEVVGGAVRLNPLGRIVQAEWERLASQFSNIALEAFVVMPNHVHGIIVIQDGATLRNDVDRETGYLPTQIGVGATHRMQDVNLSGKQPAPIETGDGHGGSPVDANDESTDIHETGMQDTPPDSPDRETRATRQSPTGVSKDDRYGPTEVGGWVDGSPLRNDGVDRAPAPNGPGCGSLGAMIGQFKSRVTKRIWAIPEYSPMPIWQRNYYEHIIRNEAEWGRICQYIQNNPLRWEEDQLHPSAPPNRFNQDKQHG